MVEDFKGFESIDRAIASYWIIEEKRKLEETAGRQTPLDEQLNELRAGKKIPEIALEEINSIVEDFRSETRQSIAELKKVAEEFNAPLEMIEKQTKILEEKFESILKKFGIYYIEAAELLYKDEKFDIANYNFFRKEGYRVIDEVFAKDHKKSIEDIDKNAIIFFDLDGLKAVNDISGHSAGDEFLKISSEIFNNGKTFYWLRRIGLKVVSAHRSGDEFMVLISGDRQLSLPSSFEGVDGEKVDGESISEYALGQFQIEFEQDERFAKLVDFHDPEIRKKIEQKGIVSEEEWSEEIKFSGSVSGGTAGFLDAFRNLDLSEKEVEDLSYREIVRKILGKMMDMSDKKMVDDKNQRKKQDTFLNKINQSLGR